MTWPALGARLLALSVVLLAVPLDGPQVGVLVPLAVAALAATVAVLLVRAAVVPAAGPAVVRPHEAPASVRSPMRQCDPDSAGHRRPRAPGRAR